MTSRPAADFKTVRELGLAFARTEESLYFRGPALKVDGEVFVVQASHRSAEPNTVGVAIPFEHRDELISSNPAFFYVKPHYQNYPVVLVRLDEIDRETLRKVLRSGYDAVATGRVKMGRSRVARRLPSLKKYVRRAQ